MLEKQPDFLWVLFMWES